MRQINSEGLALLKSLEGCKLASYQDQGGIWTIGYGSTGPGIGPNLTWTQKQVDDRFKQDLEKFEQIDQYLSALVTDNQFSALVCLAYNIGLRALKLSQVLRKVNLGENPDSDWMQWSLVNGVRNKGLVNRRKLELQLFHK